MWDMLSLFLWHDFDQPLYSSHHRTNSASSWSCIVMILISLFSLKATLPPSQRFHFLHFLLLFMHTFYETSPLCLVFYFYCLCYFSYTCNIFCSSKGNSFLSMVIFIPWQASSLYQLLLFVCLSTVFRATTLRWYLIHAVQYTSSSYSIDTEESIWFRL